MIVREFFQTREDGVDLYRTYSDKGLLIVRNDGEEYDFAIDVEDTEYTYVESDKPIKEPYLEYI